MSYPWWSSPRNDEIHKRLSVRRGSSSVDESPSLSGAARIQDRILGMDQSLRYKMQNHQAWVTWTSWNPCKLIEAQTGRPRKSCSFVTIKKPWKAEVNYIPLHPKGETTESLENERMALLSELNKRDNEGVIKAKMEKSFSHRRLEIVEQRPNHRGVQKQMACPISAEWSKLKYMFCMCWHVFIIVRDGWLYSHNLPTNK